MCMEILLIISFLNIGYSTLDDSPYDQTEATPLKMTIKKIYYRWNYVRTFFAILKQSKEPKNNLTYNQQLDNKIYSFDKGPIIVRIKNSDEIDKINEQIGKTEIINKDPAHPWQESSKTR